MPEPLLSISSPDFDRAVRVLSAGNVRKAEQKPISTALKDSANLARKNIRARAKAHRRSGRMAGRVRIKSRGSGIDNVRRISAGAPANLIVGGVKAHSIVSDRPMPLHTGRGRGSTIMGFARAVEHPGFAGDPFVHHGIQDSIPGINRILDAAGEQIVRDLARQINRGGF